MKLSSFSFKSVLSLIPAFSALIFFHRRALAICMESWLPINGYIAFIGLCGAALLLFMLYILIEKKFYVYKSFGILYLVLMMYFISLLLAPNDVGFQYMRDFLLYCISGAVIISFVDDNYLMIKMYCLFSVAIFVLGSPLPFIASSTINYHDMGAFASGMAYGEWIMVPAFSGIYLMRNYYNKKWAVVPEVACFVLTFLYANRGSLLAVLCFIVLYKIWIEDKWDNKWLYIWCGILIFALASYFFLESFLLFVDEQLLPLIGIKSRAVNVFLKFLQGNDITGKDFTSGRLFIYGIALEYFKASPLFGIGLGTFTDLTRIVFVHNIVLDILTTFGLVGGGIFFFILIKVLFKTFQASDKELKLVLLLLFINCFPRLLLSKTFVNDVPFWIYVIFTLSKCNPCRKALEKL